MTLDDVWPQVGCKRKRTHHASNHTHNHPSSIICEWINTLHNIYMDIVSKVMSETLSVQILRQKISDAFLLQKKIVHKLKKNTNPDKDKLRDKIELLKNTILYAINEVERVPCPTAHTEKFKRTINEAKEIVHNLSLGDSDKNTSTSDMEAAINRIHATCSDIVSRASSNPPTLSIHNIRSRIDTVNKNIQKIRDTLNSRVNVTQFRRATKSSERVLLNELEQLDEKLDDAINVFESPPCPLLHTPEFQSVMRRATADIISVKTIFYRWECNLDGDAHPTEVLAPCQKHCFPPNVNCTTANSTV